VTDRTHARRRGRVSARRTIENELRRLGFARIAGVDEVGRGSLAGPVVAAARARLYEEILTACVSWSVGVGDIEEIDRLNIHHASLVAMRAAVTGLLPLPDFALVDAFRIPDLFIPQRGIVGGDRRCAGVAAASIVAKVFRDRLMIKLHRVDPRYGFDRHKGYGTADHLTALARYGYSPAHRRSFRPAALFDTID